MSIFFKLRTNFRNLSRALAHTQKELSVFSLLLHWSRAVLSLLSSNLYFLESNIVKYAKQSRGRNQTTFWYIRECYRAWIFSWNLLTEINKLCCFFQLSSSKKTFLVCFLFLFCWAWAFSFHWDTEIWTSLKLVSNWQVHNIWGEK